MKKATKSSSGSAKTKKAPASLKKKAGTKAVARKRSAAPKTRRPAARRRATAPADIDNLGELPRSYGEEQIFVIAQEPHWLFCYWDYTLTDTLDVQIFLRHSHAESDSHEGEVPVPTETNSWYLSVRAADAAYRVELGFYEDNAWRSLAQSDAVMTPRDMPAEEGEAVFSDMTLHLAFQQMVDKVRAAMRGGETFQAALSRLGGNGEFAGGKITPAQRSILESWLAMQHPALSSAAWSRVAGAPGASLFSGGFQAPPSSWSAGGASWGAAGGVSSGFLAQFGLGGASWSSAAWSSALGSWSSGALSSWAPGASWSAQPFSRPVEREFFLHVNAEVIFYGGTHPDAKLTINGQPVGLRPDGSFHFHCVFPDGGHEIPIEATSPDGQETRRAVLRFDRATARTGDVGATAQPPLPPPSGTP